MLRLAFRNLFQSPIRAVISIGGVALSLVLILSLDAILAGSERQLTAYIDHTGADVFVAQRGVRNMHMASSALPRATLEHVRAVDGVRQVAPILYLTNVIDVGDQQFLAYIIGVEPEAPFGGVWDLVEGKSSPAPGEIVLDQIVAQKSGVEIGGTVDVLGRSMKVVGLARGMTSIINSVAFINLADFFQQRGTDQVISYLLVQVEPGANPGQIAARIETETEDVTALPRDEFSIEEASIIQDMGADIISIMNLIGFMIGLAVTGLTTYTATLARRSEFGLLKAIGARAAHLYRAVVYQALISVAIGFVVAVGMTYALGLLVPFVSPELALSLTAQSLLKIVLASAGIALLSALLPIRQIAGIDPARVFRR